MSVLSYLHTEFCGVCVTLKSKVASNKSPLPMFGI